jgi:hypothetical protein
MIRNVGGIAQEGIVANEQHAVAGGHQVHFQRVGTGGDGGLVTRDDFFRIQTRQAAMANDQRCLAVQCPDIGRTLRTGTTGEQGHDSNE